MSLTSVEDLRAGWISPQSLDAFTAETIQRKLDEAEDAARAAVPDLDARIHDGRIPLIRAQRIIKRVVTRALRNPAGVRMQQESTGPFSGSITYGGDEPGEIYLTPEDRAELLGRTRTGRPRTVGIGMR